MTDRKEYISKAVQLFGESDQLLARICMDLEALGSASEDFSAAEVMQAVKVLSNVRLEALAGILDALYLACRLSWGLEP